MELNKFLQKLNNSKEKAHLSDERKKAIRGRILYLINLQEKPKLRTASFFFPILRPVPIIAAALVLILASGTISFAAENSLPGDILYPVKININENLITALQLTPASKASWEVDKTERRLTEASTLIAKGDAEPEAQAELEINFDNTANKAQESIQSLDNAGDAANAAEIVARLEAVLKAHQQILAAVQGSKVIPAAASAFASAPIAPTSTTLEDMLSDKLAKVETVKATIQAKIASKSSEKVISVDAENGIRKAQKKIDSVKKFVADNSDKLSISAAKDADQKLKEASDKVGDAESKLKGNMAGEAFNSANDAGEAAQKVQLFLDARISLGISGDGAAVSGLTSLPEASSTPTSTTPDPETDDGPGN